MFTPGSAGGRSVLVWEGPAALKESGAQVGAGQWCDKVGPVVVSYHTGGQGRSSSGLPGEMTRQLDGQFTALSLMSAEEILAGMATFDERKRSPVSHTRIRQGFRDKLAENLKDRHHFSPKVAGLWASRAMRELAVLHNPDQLLSGPQGPSLVGGVVALGDRATNSAVGSQTAQGPRELIRAAAQAAVDAGQGDRLLRMRVVLTDSPDLAKRLNAGSEVLEPRSLAEREAVSPRGSLLTVQVLSDRLAQALGGPGGLKALTRDKLRQALTQPPAQTPDPPDTPTPDGPGTDAPDMASPDGLDTAGLDGGAPDIGAPDRGAPEAPASAPQAPAPVEQVARPTDSSPSMSAPTPDLNAPDRAAPDRSAPEQSRPDRVVPEASAPEQTRPDKGTPGAGAPDAGSPGRSAPNAGAPDGGAPGSPAQAQAPAAGRTTPPSVPPVSAEPPVVPARSQRAASPTAPKQPAQPVQPGRPTQPGQPPQPGQSGKPGRPGQPVQSSRSGRQGRLAQPGQPGQSGRSAQPGRQSQPVQSGQSGRPAQPSQPGRSAQPRQPVQAGGSGLSGRGAAGVGASGANAWLEASSRLQASQGTRTPPAPARSEPFTPAAPAQPAPQRSTSGPTAGETPSRSTGDVPSRSAGGRGTDTTSRTASRSTSRSGSRSTSRSASRSAGASASRGRAAAQDPIKAFLAPTGDPQRDAVLAGISSKLDKLRERNQQRQPTQAPTRTTPTHHPHR